MTDKKQQDEAPTAAPPEHHDPVEAKRLAARRRFIKNGAAAGSGAVVLTLYHRKGYAGGGKKVNLSSAEACLSIGGSPGKKPVKVKDSITPYVFDAQGKKHKNFVEKIECELPKEKKDKD